MVEVLEQISNIIKLISPVIVTIAPALYVLYDKVYKKIKEKKKEIAKKDKADAEDKMLTWEHEASMNVVDRIRDICNYYKDTGHMDLVNFIQLENGTVATSKIYNMFIRCIAEDTRASIVPKMSTAVQRVPYNMVSDLINNTRSSEKGYLIKRYEDVKNIYEGYVDIIPSFEHIQSLITAPVKDSDGVLIGFCAFYYTHEDWNHIAEQDCKDLMQKFVGSVETVYSEYSKSKRKKRKDLGL